MSAVLSLHDAYGMLAHERKDHLHLFRNGFIYASPWVVTRNTARPTGVILLTVDGEPFSVTVDGRQLQLSAVALAPNTRRSLEARGVGLVSINVVPSAALFPAFRAIPAPGLLGLDRSAFRPFDDFLAALSGGAASIPGGPIRFAELLQSAIQQFPQAPAIDPRIRPLLDSLSQEEFSGVALPSLADRLGLSYHRTSHLFSAALGIPLKSYLAWQKQMRIFDPLVAGRHSLTEIAHAAGLPDSAYLSRLYQRWYGQRPSFARDSNSVQVFYRDGRYDQCSN